MRSRPFASADPFLKIILLFLLSFSCLGVFMLMAQGVISALYGVSFFTDPGLIKDYSKPYILQVNYVLLLFQHLGLFVVPALAFAALSAHEPAKLIGFRKTSPVLIALGVLAMIAAMPSVNAMAWANEAVSFPSFLKPLEDAMRAMEDQAGELTTALTSQEHIGYLLVNLFIIAVIPAIGEEMIFRGILLRVLESWTGRKHAAVWISAALFSGMHMQFYGFLPRLMLGALLGYLFVWTRSLWVPIAAHFANNAIALIAMYLIATGGIPAEMDDFNPRGSDLIILAASLAALGGVVYYVRRFSLSGK